jgi:uncharacterized FlaG/YvyC family protein
VILTDKKSDYTPFSLRQILQGNISFANYKINHDKNQNLSGTTKSQGELNQLADDINKLSEEKNISLVFSTDKKTGKNIIKFVDDKTKEVIKQVPSEEIMKITEQIDKFLKKNSKDFPPGFLLNERV